MADRSPHASAANLRLSRRRRSSRRRSPTRS
jgi:hypothetical protein